MEQCNKGEWCKANDAISRITEEVLKRTRVQAKNKDLLDANKGLSNSVQILNQKLNEKERELKLVILSSLLIDVGLLIFK